MEWMFEASVEHLAKDFMLEAWFIAAIIAAIPWLFFEIRMMLLRKRRKQPNALGAPKETTQ